jgi:hypothetical protein
MVPKSKIGATKKYAGVVSSVKGAKPKEPEEPKITADQVREAFQSFGFPVNANNHNDILYWTSKGQSETPKLIDELHQRRMEIIKKEDDDARSVAEKHRAHKDLMDKLDLSRKELEHKQTLGKAAMPRLSDQDLNALFDEYGLPPPDPEWARTHLPNDPDKVRSILDMQRKTADDMMKKHAKNSVNAVPETLKMGQAPGMPATPMMPMGGGGMGGPMGGQQDMTGGTGEPATPFFIGDHAIVRIANATNPQASTTWLVDAKKKVLRPFMSEDAFKNAFEDPDAAERAVVNISARELGPGGALDGFKPMKQEHGVNPDGSMKKIPFTEAQLQNRYGQKQDTAAEDRSMAVLDGIMGQMKGTAPQAPMQ